MNFAAILLTPTRLDIWLAVQIGSLLGKHALLDLGVQSAIHHNVLGGAWYGAALFIFWVRGRAQQGSEDCRRVLTILVGSIIAIAISVVLAHFISWPSPSQNPALTRLFPDYIERSPDPNSFPSQATTLYAAIAAGVYYLDRLTGLALWLGVFVLIALPRMYVGGHYLTDVLVGLAAGVLGYVAAWSLLEPRAIPAAYISMQRRRWLMLGGELIVFAWILQVATEFRDGVWLHRVWSIFMG